MVRTDSKSQKPRPLDRDLEKMTLVEAASQTIGGPLLKLAFAIAVLVVLTIFAGQFLWQRADAPLAFIAVGLAVYMAMNIGAKDVANHVAAAVGARALTMASALAIAAFFDLLGAMTAGGPVVDTISSDLILPTSALAAAQMPWIMVAALLSGAICVNVATWLRAPISTTHAIVGAVVGAGAAAAGPRAINWPKAIEISSTWFSSPFLGGFIAALLLFLIDKSVVHRADKVAAARRWVPLFIALMGASFLSFLVVQLLPGSLGKSELLGLFCLLLISGWFIAAPLIRRQAQGLENRKSSLRVLFRLPLVVSAALLSYAHGANNVSNAIGPLAAILRTSAGGPAGGLSSFPFWVLLIGGLSLAVGILLYGQRLIVLVGRQITKLDPIRSFCVVLSAALTVLAATWLGLPVSSTHIAIGSIFGVGFYREWRSSRKQAKAAKTSSPSVNLEEAQRRLLVRRSHFLTITIAWIITVPVTASFAALIYFAMSAIFV